jgi:hypothetical protein
MVAVACPDLRKRLILHRYASRKKPFRTHEPLHAQECPANHGVKIGYTIQFEIVSLPFATIASHIAVHGNSKIKAVLEGWSRVGMSSFGESEQALVTVLLGEYAAPCSPMTQIGVN